jgi:drug/metabolite transporter (DMT)-like permease
VIVLISAILYAVAGAFVKLSHTVGNLPSTELVLSRGIFQGALVVWGLYVYRDEKKSRLLWHPFGRTHYQCKIVLARGVLGGAGLLFDYHCMATLPLGDAITLMSLYPFLTIFLARTFLGEDIRPFHIRVTVASMMGAVLIAQPTFLFGRADHSDNSPKTSLGYITGILGSCCLACVLTLTRKAGTIGVHTLQLLISWAMFGIIFSLVFAKAEGEWVLPHSRLIWWYVFGACSVGAAAHFVLNYGGRLAPAGLVSVVRSSDIMWAYACEISIFNQRPNMWTCMGVFLVLASLLAIGGEKVRDGRRLMKKLVPETEKEPYADVESPAKTK